MEPHTAKAEATPEKKHSKLTVARAYDDHRRLQLRKARLQRQVEHPSSCRETQASSVPASDPQTGAAPAEHTIKQSEAQPAGSGRAACAHIRKTKAAACCLRHVGDATGMTKLHDSYDAQDRIKAVWVPSGIASAESRSVSQLDQQRSVSGHLKWLAFREGMLMRSVEQHAEKDESAEAGHRGH